MRIAMIGTGYVGLVSAACFSEFGFHVTCIDKDEEKIEKLLSGQIPIYEPGLDELVKVNFKAERLLFTSELSQAVGEADIVMLAVGTPSRRGDGHADLSYVWKAAEEVAHELSGYTVVVTKSTVPVGTGKKIREIIKSTKKDLDFDIVSNPEFLREGSAINDFMRPDRVVVGVETDRARAFMGELYRPLYILDTPILFTNIKTAELIKYAANTFLATKITFINEMANICESVGADVQDLSKAIGLDGRIGNKFLHAGPGFGGSCFPKDTRAFIKMAEQHHSPSRIIEAVVSVNDERKKSMASRIIDVCGGDVEGKTIAALGVTFKPNTDDVRESPSLDIVPELIKQGALIRVYDPEGMEEAKSFMPKAIWCDDSYDAMNGADILVIITEWNEFRALDLTRMRELLNSPTIIDLRNIYNPQEMASNGFYYFSIGRPPLPPKLPG